MSSGVSRNSPAQRSSGGLGKQMPASGMPVNHLVAPTLPHPHQGSLNPPLCSSVNDKSLSPTSCPHLGTGPTLSLSAMAELGRKHQIFNWLLRCCCCFSGSGCTGGEPSPCPPQGSSSRPLRTFLASVIPVSLFSQFPCGQLPHQAGYP